MNWFNWILGPFLRCHDEKWHVDSLIFKRVGSSINSRNFFWAFKRVDCIDLQQRNSGSFVIASHLFCCLAYTLSKWETVRIWASGPRGFLVDGFPYNLVTCIMTALFNLLSFISLFSTRIKSQPVGLGSNTNFCFSTGYGTFFILDTPRKCY